MSSGPSTSRKRTAGEMEEDDYDKFLDNTFEGDDRHEFDTYIASPRENVKSALDYWRNHHHQSPCLSRMGRDVFSAPPPESMWKDNSALLVVWPHGSEIRSQPKPFHRL